MSSNWLSRGGVLSNDSRRSGLQNLSALVVDDNRHMRKLLCTLLDAYGVGALHDASDGQSGFDVLLKVRPDFVVTDFDMKPVNGIEFTRLMRSSCPAPLRWIPVLMVTGHTEVRRVKMARDAGVSELLCKPVTARNLYQRILEMVEKPRRFVKAPSFIGPDRRRKHRPLDMDGPLRRSEDRGVTDEFLPE